MCVVQELTGELGAEIISSKRAQFSAKGEPQCPAWRPARLIDTKAVLISRFLGRRGGVPALSAVCSWRTALCIGICTHDRLLSERFPVARNIKLRERLLDKCQEFPTYRSFATPAALKLHLCLGVLLIDPDKV